MKPTRTAPTGSASARATAAATPATRRSGRSRYQRSGSKAVTRLRQWGQRVAAARISSAQYGQVRTFSIRDPPGQWYARPLRKVHRGVRSATAQPSDIRRRRGDGHWSAIEQLDPLAGLELTAYRLVVGDRERAVGAVAARPPEDRRIGHAAAAEVHLLQIADEDLLRVRPLEIVDETDEIGEPLAVHAAAGHLGLAVVEEVLRVEASAVLQLERRHDQLVGDGARDAVRGRELDGGMLGQDARDLRRGEVLAVFADPVVGAAVEVEVAQAIDEHDVAEVARVIDAVAVLGAVGAGVVEVALEEAGISGDAADLADGVGVVGDPAVAVERRRRALVAALVQDLHGVIRDLANAAARIGLAAEGADRGLGRAVQLEHVLEAESSDEAVDVGRRRAVADRVAQMIVGVIRDLGDDARLVAAVLLLERREDVVHRLADVVPVRHAVAEDVGHELAGAEALVHPDAAADPEGRHAPDEHRVRVKERHA